MRGPRADRRSAFRGGPAALAVLLGLGSSGCGLVLGIEDLSIRVVEGWSRGLGESGTQHAEDLSVTPGGDLLLSGTYGGTIELGDDTLPAGQNGDQLFLAKLDGPTGGPLWGKRLGDVGASPGSFARIAADGEGAVTAGAFQGQIGFGDVLLTGQGGTDVFVAKLDAGGAHVWSQDYGDASDQEAGDVAVDASHGALLAGGFAGTLMFGATLQTSTDAQDAFVTKLEDAGASPGWAWDRVLASALSQAAHRVVVDGDGNVIVVGSSGGNLTLDTGLPVIAGPGNFVAKLDPDGVPLWGNRLGDAGDQVTGLAVDAGGNVVVAGFFSGDAPVGVTLTSRGGTDVFVAKFAADGSLVWSRAYGEGADQMAWDVAVDAAGRVYVVGELSGSMNFAGALLKSAGDADALVLQLDAEGTPLWGASFGGAQAQRARCVGADVGEGIFLAGELQGTIELGHGELTAVSDEDLFVARIVPGGP